MILPYCQAFIRLVLVNLFIKTVNWLFKKVIFVYIYIINYNNNYYMNCVLLLYIIYFCIFQRYW